MQVRAADLFYFNIKDSLTFQTVSENYNDELWDHLRN